MNENTINGLIKSFNSSDFSVSLKIALDLFEDKSNHNDINLIRVIVISSWKLGQYDLSLDMLDKISNSSFDLAIKNEFKRYYAAILTELKDFSRSHLILSELLDYYDKETNDLAEVLNSIGIIFTETGEYNKGLEFYNKAYSIFSKNNNRKRLYITLYNMGIVYTRLKSYDKAIEMHTESIAKFEKEFPDDRWNLSNAVLNLAEVYVALGDIDLAERYLLKSLNIIGNLEAKYILSSIHMNLSTVYDGKKEFEKAYYHLKKYKDYQDINNEVLSRREIFRINFDINYQSKPQKNSKKYKTENSDNSILYTTELMDEKVGIFSKKLRDVIDTAVLFHKDGIIPVMITGETGTGKEIIARIVHSGFTKTVKPFITLNCSAITPTLFESELFGYVKGAFTGASSSGKQGKLDIAEGGTLFLDEIGELPLDIQPKLLRFLQTKEYYPVGSTKLKKANVRIICATNRDLYVEMQERRFRSDLFYRLHTGMIEILPLRERQEEIIPLSQMYLFEFSSKRNKNFKDFTNEVKKILIDYSWPGNIRELRNVIERAVILQNSEHIEQVSIPRNNIEHKKYQTGTSLEEIERLIIMDSLEKNNGNISHTAKNLNISRNRLKRIINNN
ncbi:MAG: sigma 54-interacting transcriptional regulator [Candidatus Delongbacteria bacterium]|nr:sigma 54-interacting transcriptional regulator [Candidatus Delongbacteria bacterium]MBN2834863.1 sigma 54-interacting transcriptional regulator [Candidatus Delongbacteria bacterium]